MADPPFNPPLLRRELSEDEYNTVKAKVLASLPDNLSEADFNRAVQPRLAQALAEAEYSPAPPTSALGGSAVGRFVANAADVLNPMNVANFVGQVATHPIDTATHLVQAQVDQGRQALDSVKQGRYSEAVGHGLAAVTPIVGPLAAQTGEQMNTGDYAGGLGRAAGLLAPFAVQKALEARVAANPRTADILTRQAQDQVAQQVLAPGNPRFKGVAQAIAPDVLARKLAGGRDELRQAADEGMAEAGGRIDAANQAAGGPTAQVPVGSIVSRLQSSIAELKDSTGQPLSDQAASRIQVLQDKVTQLRALGGKTGTASFDDLRRIRDENYRVADEAKGYAHLGDQNLADQAWGSRETGGAIRETFATRSPDAAQANADYSFFKSLDRVLDPVFGRPKSSVPSSGVTGGTRTVGAVVGNMVGGPKAAFVLSAVVPWVRQQMASPAWQLADAQSKLKLAAAMRQGNIGLMKSAMVRIEQSSGATSPSAAPASTGPVQ